ncbi:MAG: hypothetical protein ACRET2_05785 [Steroidobacteraceae bacterium]
MQNSERQTAPALGLKHPLHAAPAIPSQFRPVVVAPKRLTDRPRRDHVTLALIPVLANGSDGGHLSSSSRSLLQP